MAARFYEAPNVEQIDLLFVTTHNLEMREAEADMFVAIRTPWENL
jgi:hypothetical protein